MSPPAPAQRRAQACMPFPARDPRWHRGLGEGAGSERPEATVGGSPRRGWDVRRARCLHPQLRERAAWLGSARPGVTSADKVNRQRTGAAAAATCAEDTAM